MNKLYILPFLSFVERGIELTSIIIIFVDFDALC